MKVNITGRHTRIPDDVKEYAQGKLEPLGRFNRHARSLDVILDEDHLSKLVDCIAHLDRGSPLVVKAEHADWMAVLDLAHDKLESALRRLKERVNDRDRGQQRRRSGADTSNAGAAAGPAGGSPDDDDTGTDDSLAGTGER